MISFARLNETWETLSEPFISSYKVGLSTIRISSTSAMLGERLTRAFAHLPTGEGIPDLKIRIWSGPKLPYLDWNQIQSNGYRGYKEGAFHFHHFEMIDVLSAVDVEKGIAYYVIRDPDLLPWWVNGSPLQTILHVWFREKGIQLTHTASICDGKHTLLLTGKGGSGKSTTVLSCLREGLNTLGEDYVLLGKSCAYSVYQTAKWMPHTRTLFPFYEQHIVNPAFADREKALLYYQDLFPSQLTLSSETFAIVSLRVGTRPILEKSDLQTSLQSLLLTTVMQLPHPDPRTNELLQAFAKPLAHYRLSLGPNLSENVALLRSLFP